MTWQLISHMGIKRKREAKRMEKTEKRKLGRFEEVIGKVWNLYLNKGASNFSTRRHLRRMGCFSETEVFHLMEQLQYSKRQIEKERENGNLQ